MPKPIQNDLFASAEEIEVTREFNRGKSPAGLAVEELSRVSDGALRKRLAFQFEADVRRRPGSDALKKLRRSIAESTFTS